MNDLRKQLSLVAVLALAVPGGAALAQEAGACCIQSTSLVDGWVNPAIGSDEDFFTSRSGVPNINLVVDTSLSMYQWPRPLCAANDDCTCGNMENADHPYDPAETYEAEIKNLNSGTFYNEWFNQNKVYNIPTSTLYGMEISDFGVALNTSPGVTTWTGASRNAAITTSCSNITDATIRGRCETCLRTDGYFFGTDSRGRRAVGNYLNTYSPRYLLMRRTVKQVVRDMRKVRMSMTAFSSAGDSLGDTDVPKLARDMNPACNQSNPFTNSSSFDSNRQSIIGELESLRFNFTTPLARSLWMAGYLFQQSGNEKYDTDFPGWESTVVPSIPGSVVTDFAEKSGQNRTICNKCQTSAIILLTDGEPNTDSDTPIDSKVTQNVWADCPECEGNDLDEIAEYLNTTDMHPGLAENQTINTYTVAFGLDSSNWGYKLLRHTAEVGNPYGLDGFKTAANAAELKQALLELINLIADRNTSFSSASVSPIQTEAVRLAAVLPRLSPKQTTPWWGEVWRFDLMNEFVEGIDQNGDGDKDDIFVLDEDEDVVVEDDRGRFIKQGSSPAVEANEIWEARKLLVDRGHADRTVLTVVDSDNNGRFDHADDQVAFTVANAERLLPYLGIAGAPNCPTGTLNSERGRILEGLGLTLQMAANFLAGADAAALPATQQERDVLCAKVVVQWVRGMDLANEDKDEPAFTGTETAAEIFTLVYATRNDTRPSVLGDIFHSSPIAAASPVDRFLCDLGLNTQCVRSLYATDFAGTPTPLASETVSNDSVSACLPSTGQSMDAYDAWHFKERRRDRLLLVGANDGMLHAFHDGDAGAETCVGGRPTYQHEATSGFEAWAFIPPDQLPRLHERIFKHVYYVDGDIMVRDIWVDENSDNTKQSTEFKTVAIVPEGRGGPHYFALELRWDSTTGANRGNILAPVLRWMFPQPCSPESAEFGKTLYSLAPKAPPIGPVLLDAAAAGIAEADAIDRGHTGGPSVERWVAALSGGWSPGFEKGRGIYVVDAWSGTVNGRQDNLWWKFEYDPTASGAQNEPRRFLTRGVAAPVALVDYGASTGGLVDGYFDTAVFGDLGGQIWVTRMYEPGIASSGGLINNWSGGRALAMAKSDTTVYRRAPFYYLPTIGIQTDNGALRVFLGSGSRYSLLEGDVGECRFDNPQACAKYGCSPVRTTTTLTRPGLTSTEMVEWVSGAGGASSVETETAIADPNQYCGPGVGSVAVSGRVTETLEGCSNPPAGFNTAVRDITYECGEWTSGQYTCRITDGGTPNLDPIPIDHNNLGSLGRNRYYGFWAFGGRSERIFDEAQTTTGDTSAFAFDQRALTDRGGSGSGDLVDVTAITCTSVNNCTGDGAGYDDLGWFYEYEGLDRKTATGSTLLAGCTLWSGLYPEAADGGGDETCLTSAIPRARFYQANYLSGLPNCATSFLSDGGFSRFISINTPAPPPEPAPVISINEDGVMRVGVQMVPPGGSPQSFTVGQNNEPLQMIYELDVNRAMHNCRHVDGGVCAGITP